MQAIILGLNSVPGVMGAMLSDERGNILAHSFPAYFDTGTIKGAAELLQDNTSGLQDATGGVKLFDIRFELGRLIVRPLPRMFVVVLCQPTVNIQLLFISLNVAVKKIEKLSSDPLFVQTAQQVVVPQVQVVPTVQAPPVAVAAPRPVSAAPGYYRVVSDGKGVMLTCDVMKKATGALWEVDSASVNRNTALEISDFFKTGPFKKLTITNPANGISKHVPVSVLQHDRDGVYDGKIFPNQALFESLHAKEGDQVRVEIVIGGGMFGWEGI
jgi:predicted regulator of Ras-like GTPase activity (Roadblock/LC7/MglB family)